MSKQRESSIELLKIVSIFIIVVSHVTQSLGRNIGDHFFSSDYVVNLGHSTTSITVFCLVLFRYFGALGNLIFFVCSAWFLSDNKKVNGRKILHLSTDIFIISVAILGAFMLSGVRLQFVEIIRSFLPIGFSNNWYMTAYILFYLIHGYINTIVEKMGKEELLKVVLLLSVLYLFFGTIKGDLYCGNNLILFITVYLVIVYLKKYMNGVMESVRINIIFLLISLVSLLVLIIVTDIVGLRVNILSNQLLHWNRNNNPLLIVVAIALFNIFRAKHFVSSIINYISSLSFLIYIIHENILVAKYFRGWIWHMLYSYYSHSLIILQVVLFSVVLSIGTCLLSIVYQKLFMKLFHWLADITVGGLRKQFGKFYSFVLRID